MLNNFISRLLGNDFASYFQEYISDTELFQTHLIEVHRLTEQVQSSRSSQQQISSPSTPNEIDGMKNELFRPGGMFLLATLISQRRGRQ